MCSTCRTGALDSGLLKNFMRGQTVILHLEAQGAEEICVCMGQPVGLRAPGWRNVVGT